MTSLPLRLGVVYDFRNPADSGIETPRLYAEILDQVAWLDGLGLDLVWFTEHHFVEDGYRRGRPWRARWPRARAGCASRRTSVCCRSRTRCGSRRTSRFSTT